MYKIIHSYVAHIKYGCVDMLKVDILFGIKYITSKFISVHRLTHVLYTQ